MATQTYSPIIKGKLNDLKALGRLSPRSRSIAKPMVEAMPLKKGEDVDSHIAKLAHYLVKHAPLGDLFLDFYGLVPGLKASDGTDAIVFGYKLVKGLGRTVTPVYGFSRDDSLWSALRETVKSNGQGFCFRIDIDDLDDQAEDTWTQILERSAFFGIKPQQTDLVIDLRDIGAVPIDKLQGVVLDFLGMNQRAPAYRSIVLAGSTALKTVTTIPKDGVGEVARKELVLWSRLQRDLSQNIELVFGDYGVIHPDFSDQGPNKHMNAKIRYTYRGRIAYFRGHGLRYPVKDYSQYHQLASQVRDSQYYRGRAFSYGDWYIDTVADFNTTPGHPGTWVHADMNHHLEYTARQMTTLIGELREVEKENDLALLPELS